MPGAVASQSSAHVVVLRNAGQFLPLQCLDTLRRATVTARAPSLDFSRYLAQNMRDYVPARLVVGPRLADATPLR